MDNLKKIITGEDSPCPNKRLLAEKSRQAIRDYMANRCPRCLNSGYTGGGVAGYSGLLAQLHAGAEPATITWCECDVGQNARRWFEENYHQLHQERIKRLFREASIPTRFVGLGLNTIPQHLVQGKVDALRAAYELMTTGQCQGKEGLGLIGPRGVGKTGILSVVFQAMINKGTPGLWIELYQFFQEVQSEYDRPNSQAAERIEVACNVPLLMLDDVGDPDRRNGNGTIKVETDDKRSILWRIVDRRHAYCRPILWTSNLNREDIGRQFGQRIADRLWEACHVVVVGGVDLRREMRGDKK